TIEKVDLDKAINFYKDRFSDAGDFTFIFVGNFDKEKIKPMLEKYLGSLRTTERGENWRDVGMYPPTGKIEKTTKKGIEAQSFVRLIISGKFDWNPEEKYLVNSMMKVFNTRLREVLREDKGGTYGVGCWASPNHFPRDEYQVNIVWGCSPDRCDSLIGNALDIVKEMNENAPDSLNMVKVKETQRREYEVNLKENRYWLSKLNDAYFYEEDPKGILDLPNRIEKLTAEDIHKTSKKYLNQQNFARFVLLPENK
ncbi:MAG: zinc protease, partial [Bacteroidota bacterium]|nr:zinc protease [Bacteroidota bacterium]